MKNENKEVDFGIIENAGLNELESLSQKVTPAGNDEKNKILEMSRRKYDIRKNDNTTHNEETVSGSEPYRPRKLWKIMSSAAACIALVGCIAGSVALMHRNGRINGTDTEATTVDEETTVTEEATSLPDDIVEQHEVFFRRGDSPESPVVLTGNNIEKAEMGYMPEENGEGQYVINGELDREGTDIFSQVTAELAGTDTPISIWVDGECVSAPTVSSSITNGKFIISGNFDKDTAAALAEKLSNCHTAYGLTSDDLEYGNSHADLIGQCMDEFIANADDSITDAFYCEYDINGDDVPELFIQYFNGNPETTRGVCELYSLQNGRYQNLGLKKSQCIIVQSAKNGFVISQSYDDVDHHDVFILHEDGSIELSADFRISVEDQTVIYTINGARYSAEEWDEKFSASISDDAIYLEKLTKDFYHKY